MQAEVFLEKFDILADVHDAAARLRVFVLQLAFSGGLSGRRPEGAPTNWEKLTIGSIASTITTGFACSRTHKVEGGHVHLRTHNISTRGILNFDLLVKINPRMVDPQKSSIKAGDILFNNTNSQDLVGKTSLVDRDYDYAFSNHITRIRLKEGVLPAFVALYLTLLRNSGHFSRICTRWINQAAVNTDALRQQTIPLPSLEEQKRIVAKVEELIALCDALEAQQERREALHASLVRASLTRFAEAPTSTNLDFLFHKSFDIAPADIRKSILTLAVQGKLVTQEPEDEPASATLATSGVDLKRWNVDDDEQRYEVPRTWTWLRFAGVGEQRLGKMLDASKNGGEPKPYLRNANVQWMRFDLTDIKELRVEEREKGELRLTKGDLLICEGGEPGRCAIWNDEVPEMYFQKALHRVRPCKAILPAFLALHLQIDCQNGVLAAYFTGATIKHLTGRSLDQYPIPIPPLEEQRRIVAKVDQLTALVNQLETELGASRTIMVSLLDALVAEPHRLA